MTDRTYLLPFFISPVLVIQAPVNGEEESKFRHLCDMVLRDLLINAKVESSEH